MSENAMYNGKRITIGTCEDMLYLRAEQARLVRPVPNSLDPVEQAANIRFRFPFPDEDDVPPGAFDPPFRAVAVNAAADYLREAVPHRSVRFGTGDRRYIVKLPCPLSREAADSGLPFKDTWSGTVEIVQQRLWQGRLVLVCDCAACGIRFRLPELADADPVIAACREAADRARRAGHQARAAWWAQIADRIAAGYTSPCDLGNGGTGS